MTGHCILFCLKGEIFIGKEHFFTKSQIISQVISHHLTPWECSLFVLHPIVDRVTTLNSRHPFLQSFFSQDATDFLFEMETRNFFGYIIPLVHTGG